VAALAAVLSSPHISFQVPYADVLVTSVGDLDPHGSVLILVGWIWILSGNVDPDPEGQNRPKEKG
jgi:hypothetical protein